MMMTERIIFRCKGKDYDLVRVWWLPSVLVLQRGEWGNADDVRQFLVHETERLQFGENPELLTIYDDATRAWDLDKVYALLHLWCEEMDA
jgi:hypothetical protein